MAGVTQFLSRLLGSSNERRLKKYYARVQKINALEDEFAGLTDEALRAKTDAFRAQLKQGARLDQLLEPAFATVREAAKRTLGQRHFDVQLIGGMALHDNKIAEMKTGEGKTLVATLPCYLHALSGEPVHVVTVNDYLAQRDAQWMAQIHEFLGLRVGCIIHNLDHEQRRAAYVADITYGTNNEFAFDYLRDNMAISLEQTVQRGHGFAIVDEVDSILIDEARTPLIISGALEDQSNLYITIDKLIPQLEDADYELEEKFRTATLTDAGNEHVEDLLKHAGLLEAEASIYDIHNVTLVHHVNNALRAHKVFQKDRDYIVKGAGSAGRVVLIDEFTGRMMEGRRYSDGLHQALEAKETTPIQPENRTLASITFQNYFRLYDTLSGMTGTAATEAEEFIDIYGLDVLEIPTNTPIARMDDDDEVYRTAAEKYQAISDMVRDCQTRKQPVLVGTTSIEKSELLSAQLKKQNIKHNVLNARYHEQEANIIAQAGVPGAVTIATNMAGRGTDIQLGGNVDMRLAMETDEHTPQETTDRIIAAVEADKKTALEAGGLCVIGTERHESRRIDNQLRGRSGRQGDPGQSRFFLSLEDDLMRIFGTDRMEGLLRRLGLKEGEAIVHPWINKALERAQKKVEAHNFDARKNTLKFDDVMNDQRKVIFEQRVEFMQAEQVSDIIRNMRHDVIDELIATHIPPRRFVDEWDIDGLSEKAQDILNLDLPFSEWAQEEGIADEEISARLYDAADRAAAAKASRTGHELMRKIEKAQLIQSLDQHWREHLLTLEHLRQIVNLRGYGQRDPLNEFKLEAFALFSDLLTDLRSDVTRILAHGEILVEAPEVTQPEIITQEQAPLAAHPSTDDMNNVMPAPSTEEDWGKVPRNAPCPCGSGKKYKHCHGAIR